MSKDGGSVKRWVLEGTDYVYPRTTNKILEAYLKSEGRQGRRHHDQLHAVRLLRLADRSSPKIKKFGSAGKKTAVVSTINGDANVPFYKELGNQGLKATDIPVVAFSVGEEELPASTPSRWSAISPPGTTSSRSRPGERRRSSRNGTLHQEDRSAATNDPMEAHYIGFNMWVKAVEKAKIDRCRQGHRRAAGHEVPNLTGGMSKMTAEPPHHQAGLHRRDPWRRPVRRGVEDRRSLVRATPGPTICPARRIWSRLGQAEVRQLQHRHQEVRRS